MREFTKLLMCLSLFTVALTSCDKNGEGKNEILDSGIIKEYSGPRKYVIETDFNGEIYSAVTNIPITSEDVGKRVRLWFKILSDNGTFKNAEISMVDYLSVKECIYQSAINSMPEAELEEFEATLGTTGLKHNAIYYAQGFLNFDIVTLSDKIYANGDATLIYDDIKSAKTGIQEFYLRYNTKSDASYSVIDYRSFPIPDIFGENNKITARITYKNFPEPGQGITNEVITFEINKPLPDVK